MIRINYYVGGRESATCNYELQHGFEDIVLNNVVLEAKWVPTIVINLRNRE